MQSPQDLGLVVAVFKHQPSLLDFAQLQHRQSSRATKWQPTNFPVEILQTTSASQSTTVSETERRISELAIRRLYFYQFRPERNFIFESAS
jgi:hypothetical protein